MHQAKTKLPGSTLPALGDVPHSSSDYLHQYRMWRAVRARVTVTCTLAGQLLMYGIVAFTW